MKKIKSLVALASIFTASNAIAGGLTASGKISLLSHEVSGSYVQILDAASTVINTDPDTCGGADMYFLPLDHANYTVLSSSLLTAEMTQRELAFHVEGCENGMAKIAFVRFGNWDGVVLSTPTTPPTTSPSENGSVRKQTFSTTGTTTTNASFVVPDGVHVVNVTMCGGGGAGGMYWGNGGGGATTILKKPVSVFPNQIIDVVVGGGGLRASCVNNCPIGKDSKFGDLVAPGAKSGKKSNYGGSIGETVIPENFNADSPFLVLGGRGGIVGTYRDGEGVAGNPGGVGISASSAYGGGGGASYFGAGGNTVQGAQGEDGFGYCSGGAGASVAPLLGGNGAPGIVIVEW